MEFDWNESFNYGVQPKKNLPKLLAQKRSRALLCMRKSSIVGQIWQVGLGKAGNEKIGNHFVFGCTFHFRQKYKGVYRGHSLSVGLASVDLNIRGC